jgi:RNA polymerase sigma-70 factor (ECF subfamily)
MEPVLRPLEPTAPVRRAAPYVQAFDDELDHVFRTFRRFGFADADAEDLTQEVFLIMWRRWDEYDPHRPLRPWLSGIAFRVAQHHRRKRREVLDPELETEDPAAGPHEHLAASRARALVLAALERLPERHRSALILSDLDGLTMPAVAQALAVPLATAYTRVRRARIAFTNEVARLQETGAPRSEARLGLLGCEGLLAYERTAPPLPGEARRRMLGRANRALETGVTASSSTASRGWSRLTPTSLSLATALVALVTAGSWVGRPEAAAPSAAPPPVTAARARITRTSASVSTPDPRSAPPVRLSREVLAASNATATSRGLASGLTAYWRFDDGARDLSSGGRECHVRGIDPARAFAPEGVHGGALALRGRGWLDCSVTAADGTQPKEVTVAAWVKPDRPVTFHRSIISREATASNEDDIFLGFSGGSLDLHSGGWNSQATVPHNLRPGHWTHVAFTQGADGLVVAYLDGVEALHKQVRPLQLTPGPRRWLIGAGSDSGGRRITQKFHGMIDEVAVYDRALAPADVAALAAGTQPALSE